MEPWDEGLGPCKPVIRGDRLYGRGGADDGYSFITACMAIKSLEEQGMKVPRVCLVLETEEESGSPNLVYLLQKISEKIGVPDIMICLDSGACDWNSLWLTSSLKGMVAVTFKVEALTIGAHSGLAGGMIPETFRVAEKLVNRLENIETYEVAEVFQTEVPEWKIKEAKAISDLMGKEMYTGF